MSQKNISSGVVHRVPPDLKKALTSDPKALTAWEDITPLARNTVVGPDAPTANSKMVKLWTLRPRDWSRPTSGLRGLRVILDFESFVCSRIRQPTCLWLRVKPRSYARSRHEPMDVVGVSAGRTRDRVRADSL